MKNQILIGIKESLERMKEVGEVDLSILENLAELRSFLETIKDKWLEIEDTDGFYFYMAVHNVEHILDRMEERFRDSQSNDSAKISEDSLRLLSDIDRVLEASQKFTINEEAIDDMLKKTYSLREKASNNNLVESWERSVEGLDIGNLNMRLTALARKL